MSGTHHLLTRKRNRDSFPHPQKLKRFFDYLMYSAAAFAPLVVLPQVIHIFSGRTAAGLSLLTWTLMTGGSVMWSVYGFLHKEKLVFIANLLMAGLNLVVIVGIILYG